MATQACNSSLFWNPAAKLHFRLLDNWPPNNPPFPSVWMSFPPSMSHSHREKGDRGDNWMPVFEEQLLKVVIMLRGRWVFIIPQCAGKSCVQICTMHKPRWRATNKYWTSKFLIWRQLTGPQCVYICRSWWEREVTLFYSELSLTAEKQAFDPAMKKSNL